MLRVCRTTIQRSNDLRPSAAAVFLLAVIFAVVSGSARAETPSAFCLGAMAKFSGLTSAAEAESEIRRLESELRAQPALTRAQRASELAKYGDSIQSQLSRFPVEDRQRINFFLARSVVALEQFEPQDYRAVDKMSYEELGDGYVHLNEFPKWAEGYVDWKPPHEGRNFEVKLLTSDMMRDLNAHNRLPVIMKLHDLRHIHYAVGHARPLALYFMAARSENVNRYGILMALFEGIDIPKFQAPHEIRICSHFQSLGMTIEEAMYHVGRAPNEQIETWMDQLKLRKKFGKIYPATWRPTYVAGRDVPGETPQKLETEIDAFIRSLDEYRADPSKARYYNFRRERPEAGDQSKWEDDPTIK